MKDYEFLSQATITIEDVKKEIVSESYLFNVLKWLTKKK